MKPVGFARYLSRLASSQVTFASFIAGEKSYPGTEALLLPTMPARWPDLVLTGLRRVAGHANAREHGLASRGITGGERCRRASEHGHQEQTCFAHRRPHFVRPHLTS